MIPLSSIGLAGEWWRHLSAPSMFPRCEHEGCRKRLRPGRRARAFFRQKWYCSPECLESAVRVQVEQRPVTEARAMRHRIPLGLMMLARGQITAQQLERSVTQQRVAGRGRIGEWLQEQGHVGEREITAAVAAQWGCPMLHSSFQPDARSGALVPRTLQTQFRMSPVHFAREERVLSIGFEERVDYALLGAIGRMLDCRTEPCIISHNDWINIRREERSSNEAVFQGPLRGDEIARIVRSHFVRHGARELRMERFQAGLWFRLQGNRVTADVLFQDRTM